MLHQGIQRNDIDAAEKGQAEEIDKNTPSWQRGEEFMNWV